MLFGRRYGNINKLISAKTEYGRLAQLVEHLLDVQEVTGSSPVQSTTIPRPFGLGIFLWWTVQDSNRAAARSDASKATVRLCLARDGQPIGTSTKKDAVIRSGDFLLVAVQGSNSNNDDRGLRPKQGGVVGAAF